MSACRNRRGVVLLLDSPRGRERIAPALSGCGRNAADGVGFGAPVAQLVETTSRRVFQMCPRFVTDSVINQTPALSFGRALSDDRGNAGMRNSIVISAPSLSTVRTTLLPAGAQRK